MKRGWAVAALLWGGACATTPPVTKIVAGRVIQVRAVPDRAYEHVTRALLYAQEERWEESLTELRRALAFDPDAPETHARLAEILLHLDRLDDAASEVLESLNLAITPAGLLADAQVRQARGDVAGAVTALQQAVDQARGGDPAELEQIQLELAEAQVLALDTDGAATTLRALLHEQPESIEGHVRLGTVEWARGRLLQTRAELGEALKQEPNQLDALLTLAWLEAARGETALATAVFTDAMDRSEQAPDVVKGFVRFLMGVGREDDARALVEDLGAPDGEHLIERIELLRLVHQPQAALALAAEPPQEATEDLKVDLIFARAEILEEQNRRSEAIAALQSVGADSQRSDDASLRLAALHRDEGKRDEAERILNQLAAHATADSADERLPEEIAILRASVAEKRGDRKRGIVILTEADRHSPGSVRLLLALAALEERDGQWQKALTRAEQIRQHNPASVEALNFWGFVAADHDHNLPLALAHVRAAAALEPAAGSILDSLGWALLKLGDVIGARECLGQAQRLEPEDPEILSHLAEVHARGGDRLAARSALKKALTFHPDDSLRASIEGRLRSLGVP